MKKMDCTECNKFRKFEKPRLSYIFNETLVIYIICGKCGGNNDTVFKKEESTEILKVLGLVNNTNN